MDTINKYYKAKVNGEFDYLLAPDNTTLRGSDSVVIAKYIGYSTSEETDVYELNLMGGSKTLTDYSGIQELFGNPTPNRNYTEYVKTILSNGNRALVATDTDVYIIDSHAIGYTQVKDGYNSLSDAETDSNSVSCYRVQLKNGDSVVINSAGQNDLEDDWC